MSLDLAIERSRPLRALFEVLRCCRTACAFAWSCQKFGSLIFSSSAASCWRAEEASKIAPHKLDAFLELGVALLQVFDVFSHGYRVQRKMEK